MPAYVRLGSAWVPVTALQYFNGSVWASKSGKYWSGSQWVDFMQTLHTYAAIASRSYNDGWNYDPSHPKDVWQSDTGLAQGAYATSIYIPDIDSYDSAQDGPFYGTFYFGSGSGKPTELDGKTIVSAQIYLRRYSDSPGSSGAVPVYLYKSTLTSVPGSGAHSPDGNVTGSGYLICSLTKNQGGWFTLPNVLAQAVMDGYCLCIYSGGSNLTRLYGIESASYKPQIRITVQ